MRLAAAGTDRGQIVLPLWFLPQDGEFWCATNRRANIVKVLRKNPKCAFEIAEDRPPYRGVRGQGDASLHDDQGAEILDKLLALHAIQPSSKLGKFLAKNAAEETAIRIVPQSLMSWDFTERMTG